MANVVEIQPPQPCGILKRMQHESAVRAFVRQLSRRHVLSDAGTREDSWQQVEDIVALVPAVTSNFVEMENLAHALLRVLTLRNGRRKVSVAGTLASGHVDIAAFGNILRLRVHDAEITRIISVKLQRDGARRIDDHSTAS